MTSRYDETYARSLEDPEAFWAEAAEGIDWEKRWDRVFDHSRLPFSRWFPGAEVNTCHNALDRHVDAGRGEQTALIYDSPVTGIVQSFTYAELQGLAARFAGALSARGVGRGDRVVLYLPMVPESCHRDAGLRPASAPFTPWCSAVSRRTSLRPGSTTRSPRSSSVAPAASK